MGIYLQKNGTRSHWGGGTKKLEEGITSLEKSLVEVRNATILAQNTADTAKTNAAAAREVADTAKNNAATAQNTANNMLPKTYVTNARNITDNSRALSANENNAGNVGSLRNLIETVASERPGTVYQTYKTNEYICVDGGKLLTSLQLPNTGIYIVIGGIRYDNNINGTIHGNNNLNMFLGVSYNMEYQEDYNGSNGACIPINSQICHLGTSSIMTVPAGAYVNLGLFGPPINIKRTWIRAVLIKKN